MILIFDKTDDTLLMSTNVLPSEIYSDTDKYVIAKMPDGETYDFTYSYTYKDGIAIKGDLISVDEKEEVRKLDEWKAQQYQRDRKEEYDKLNQDEMRYDDVKNSTTTWIDTIDAIKAKYPKP